MSQNNNLSLNNLWLPFRNIWVFVCQMRLPTIRRPEAIKFRFFLQLTSINLKANINDGSF